MRSLVLLATSDNLGHSEAQSGGVKYTGLEAPFPV